MGIITVSREYGADSPTFGAALAKNTGYCLVDRETMIYMLRGVWALRSQLKIESGQTESDPYENITPPHLFLRVLEEKLIWEYAQAGKTVIIGRGASCLLKDVPYALHVRLVAPIEMRMENTLRRIDISPEMARNLINKSDMDRSAFVRTRYCQDWANHQNYDVVFDTSEHAEEEIIKRIKDLAEEKQQMESRQERLKLAKRALASKIKASLISNLHINISELETYYDGKNIIINGIIKQPDEKSSAELIVKTIAGNEPYISRLRECSTFPSANKELR